MYTCAVRDTGHGSQCKQAFEHHQLFWAVINLFGQRAMNQSASRFRRTRAGYPGPLFVGAPTYMYIYIYIYTHCYYYYSPGYLDPKDLSMKDVASNHGHLACTLQEKQKTATSPAEAANYLVYCYDD